MSSSHAPDPKRAEIADQRDAAIRALAEHIYVDGFSAAHCTNREWADLAIRAAVDFADAWDARK